MFTNSEYDKLWNDHFHTLGIPKVDTYDDYVVRECYFQDYLDLFRGYNSRSKRILSDDKTLPCHGEHTYFKDSTENNAADCLWDILRDDIIKEIDSNKIQKENSKLRVRLGEKKLPKIEYILIGEAPAKQAKSEKDLKDSEQEQLGKHKKYPLPYNCNTYFYNPNQYKPTNYFSAPFKALVGKKSKHDKSSEKKKELIELANEGVLLLDLFPFALDYDKIRDKVIEAMHPTYFWHLSFDSMMVKLRHLRPYMSNGVMGCLIAPPKLSYSLANGFIIGALSTFGLGFDMRMTITNGSIHSHDHRFFSKESFGTKTLKGREIPKDTKDTVKTILIPVYMCCGYGGNNYPHEFFIKNAIK
jgi:hypothetical protein